MAPRDTRLHTVDLGGNVDVEIMVSTPQFGPVEVCLNARAGDEQASVNLSATAARATAHLLLLAADEVDRRNPVRKAVA